MMFKSLTAATLLILLASGSQQLRAAEAKHAVSAAICEHVRSVLAQPGGSAARLDEGNITWSETDADLPEDLAPGASQADFDFDNDGTIDRVFRTQYEVHYMMGSTLLVQSGRSSQTIEVAGGKPVEDAAATFLPCQWDKNSIAIGKCPPFTQDNDEAGFAIARRGAQKPVFFRARYTDLTPFRFEDQTYVAVTSHSYDSRAFTAVVRPQANKRYVPKCLLRNGRIENTW
jgi:hypothetical protein